MAENIGLILSGGGARGAYEIGVLSELLPWLERDHDQRPDVSVGTSVGALNTALPAAIIACTSAGASAGAAATPSPRIRAFVPGTIGVPSAALHPAATLILPAPW